MSLSRRELIGQHLKVSRGFSEVASDLNDDFQVLMEEMDDLEPQEQARLLAAMMVQISGKLSKLHG
ncbi:MAG: hypothetical protein RBJ76_13235 [Stenomitos frigidus ULC029]